MTRLVVDWTRCDGHGLCAALAPSAIALDPWGYPLLAAEPTIGGRASGTWRSDARRAAVGCPSLALRLEGR